MKFQSKIIFRKTFSIIAGLALVLQSLFPSLAFTFGFIYAQEATPTPEVTTELTPEPTISETPSHTNEITPIITPEITPELTQIPTPTTEDAINPESNVLLPVVSSDEPPKNNGPPEESISATPSGEILEGASTTSLDTQQADDAVLSAVILENISAPSLNLDNVDPTDSATLTTDKADYAPTDTAVITGTGFIPAETYRLTIDSDDQPPTTTSTEITADNNGNFVYAYQLDGNYRPNYFVVVTTQNGTIIAQTSFTDSSIQLNWVQCKNDTDNNNAVDSPMCDWGTGSLNSNNSVIAEGNTIPSYPPNVPGQVNYRAIFEGLVAGTYEMTIKYDFSKSGILAFDFLTSNYGVTDSNLCDDLPGGVSSSDCNTLISAGASSFLFPAEDETVDASHGGGAVSLRQSSHDTTFAGFNPRTMKIYGASITSIVNLSRTGTDTGSSEDKVKITFTKSSSSSNDVIATWGGHFAISSASPVGYGLGNGAASISGAPFHMRMDNLSRTTSPVDNSVVSGGDRSVQPGALLPAGTITVIKDVVPDSSQDFGFTTTGVGLSAFSLDDDSDAILSNTRQFIGLAAGTYTVSETLVAGWLLTSKNCISDGSGSTFSQITNGISIALTSGEHITCTFTNTLQNGTLRVYKVTDPVSDTTTEFSVTATGSGTINGSATQTITGGSFVDYEVTAGTYSVSETPPAGWEITENTCTDIVATPEQTAECSITNIQKQDITACKFNDLNGNGLRDDQDTLLDDWEMTLTPGDITQSTANGCTTFSRLLPGEYTITETPQTDWSNTTALFQGVTLTSSQGETVYFGNFACATISGTKWEDLNGDGIWDEGEPILPDWSIYLNDDYESTTTDENGNYSFQVCQAGQYIVSEESSSNDWYQTYPAGISANHQIDVIRSGGNYTDRDFGNTRYATIFGYKYRDNDGNGQIDLDDLNETLAGWVIDLYDGATDIVLGSYTTLADGYYEFTGLFVNKTYYVLEQLISGWTQTYGPQPTPTPFTVQSGEEKRIDFANFENGSISGQKFNDQNGDGIKNPGETGLSSWTIDLDLGADGSIETTAITDGGGDYSFTNLGPGTYRVREQGQTGWAQTTVNPNDISLQSGQNINGVDFGNQIRGSITIIKDSLPNHAQNFSFTSVQLGNFTLDDDSNPALSNTKIFSDLGNNTYLITENTVSGWTLTDLSCRGDDNAQIDLNARTVSLNLDRPLESITCTFTNTKHGSIAGRKYNDTDADGTKDNSEIYLDGWTVYLFDAQMQMLASVVTGTGALELGQYKFTGLLPGTYYLCEEIQSGWVQTAPTSGTQYNGAYCRQRTLNAGGALTGANFGNFQYATIIVHKNVVKPDGITEVDDSTTFTSLLNGNNGQIIAEGINAIYSELTPGTYTIGEDALPIGYELVSIDDDETTTVDGQVAVTSGNTFNVYVTNRQLTANLTLVKHLPDDNGGTAVESDFAVYINRDLTSWGSHDLDPDTYSISEDSYAGYTASDWSGDCDAQGNVILLPGEQKTCEITNTRDTGTITVIKNIDGNNDGDIEDDIDQTNVLGWTWDIENGDQNISMGDSRMLGTDTYTISEDGKAGEYAFVSWSCDNGASGTTNNISLRLNKNDQIVCTFVNTPLSDIHGYKWDDADGNGQYGQGEERLSGWTIFLDSNGNGQLNENEQSIQTDSENELGWYWFYDLLPGNYRICELVKPGWQQTYPNSPSCHEITLPENGELTENRVLAVEHNFGNQEIPVRLELSKTNNASSDKAPGDNVGFTITLVVYGNTVFDVRVTDLLPVGFIYRDNSWSATRNDIPFSIPQPSYASPGVWNLGALQAGDVIKMFMIADINGDQKPGLYKDLAWAIGCTKDREIPCSPSDDSAILAMAINPGQISGTENFVGTHVNVNKDMQNNPSVNLTVTGEVLGISAELPATGVDSKWVILASVLAITGIGFVILGRQIRRLHV